MSPEVRKQTPLLSMTAAGIGHQLIRNRGTIGGSMVHCDPAADLCTTSLVLEAKVRLTSAGGKFRDVSAEKFFLGPLTTDIRHNEILSEVIFPIKKGKRGYDVEKFTMGHGDFPLFIASVMMGYSDGRFNDIAIGMGSVSDTAIRDHELESLLSGRNEIGESEIEEVVRMAMEKYEGQPTGELTREYTTKMIGVCLRKALTKSLAMIRG
jgi:CO/xanthine dehydrogenase FAD-binding subunit